MKLEVTDVSPVRKTLAIEADAEEVRKETDAVVATYASKARIPGFRAGKAPVAVIRSRFGQEIRSEVRDRLMARLYDRALKERNLHPVGDPEVEDVAYEDGESLRFKATLDVYPEFTVQGYREVEVRRPAAEVPDADVEKMLEELRQAHARLVSEEGRVAATGDVLIADLEGTPQSGEPFRREKIMIEVGASDNLPMFNDSVEGAKEGDELEFDVPYPSEFPNADLAGKNVSYRVHVHEVKRREVPELDDEFAKDMGEFDDLTALRARIRSDLEERKRAEVDSAVRRDVLDKVLLENPVPLPESLIEREIRSRMEDLVRGMMRQGLDPEKMELDWKEIREKQEEPARKTVHARLVLDRIAEQESIRASKDEVQTLIRREAERAKMPYEKLREDLVKAGSVQAIESQLVREHSLDFVVSVANIQTEE